MAYPHGIYVSEQETSLSPPAVATAGLQVVFGTAPVHLAEDPAAAANAPVLCHSFAEAAAALGYSDEWDKFTLCQSMAASFKAFGVAPVVFVNVLDPSNPAHVTLNAEEPVTPSGSQAVYRKKYVLLDTLVVKKDGEALERGVDYIASHDSGGDVAITLVSEAARSAQSLQVSSRSLNPGGVTAADVVGGTDALTGAETGLALVRRVFPKFGLVPGLILAPGWSHVPAVAAAMQAACERINGCFSCEAVIDVDSSASGATRYSDVGAAKEAAGITSPHALACWPMAKMGGQVYYLSALVGALTAYTDALNGDVPSLSPSNKRLGITATVLADGTEVLLDQEQANAVNSFGVMTAVNVGGFKSWGNSTAAYPGTTDPKDRWFAVRRFFSWWGNSFIRTYFQKVDEPANYRLIESIVDSENIRGNGFVARGHCAQAKIRFLESENPVSDILGGTIRFHMYLAPYTPAESIELTLEFDPTAVEAAITGGE